MSKWIDVNDRLPEKDTDVLVCFDDGFMATVFFGEDFDLWADSGEPIAWMPLPDPYKLPKKKQFTDDELCILRNIKSEINTLGRNINGTIYVTSDYGKSYLKLFNNLFQSLDIGEEIIIDDYVERWRILWINLLSY